MHRPVLCLLASAVLMACLAAPVASKPRAVPPGGTQQMAAVPGTFGTWAFNGKWRVKVTFIGDPHLKTYWPYDPKPGSHIVVVRGLVRNGMKETAKLSGLGLFLSDADGITFQQQSLFSGYPAVQPNSGDAILPPGATTRFQLPLEVPIGFLPTKLLIVGFGDAKPFRIDLTRAIKVAP